ncbi:type II secretion system minor pseudopilin [Marinobacterium weihaiense]|uniref:General secretion pathway protein GspK n=1 Tax=Marinobacterium weihaiense TaxID=2851016 RepID=A0ABS6MDP6_9GAMM|nr:type II secretion system protein GspK [Marinobacterium weihaiense]MBV0934275.1 general secretion pathway protein GspK [Marinobacterium weihaiense]
MRCGAVSRKHRPRRSRGIVLVTVLWVLVLLGLMATNLSLGSRSFSRQVFNAEQGTQARLAADAGISWALWSLQQPGQAGWLADGGARQMQLDDTDVTVRLQDESGKLDLNAAPSELLDALLQPWLADSRQRAALVAAIEDWRDSDDLVRLNGAEAEAYEQAGRITGPGNRPFERLSELQGVLGMTPALYQALLPSLTLATRSRTVNPQVAPHAVLMALPGASDGVVRGYIRQRREAWQEGLPQPELPFDASPYVSDRRGGVHYRVDIQARRAGRITSYRAVALTRRGAQLQLESLPALASFNALDALMSAHTEQPKEEDVQP